MPTKKITPTKLEISPEKHAEMVTRGMDALMERKRKSAPHLHTEEFTANVMKVVREIQKKKARKK